MAAADFNGDGIADLAVVWNAPFGAPGSVVILLGNGDATFQPANLTGLGVAPFVPRSVAIADFDEDGRLDVVVGLHSGSHFVAVLLGDGEGGFQPPVTYETGIEAQVVAVADFNADGHSDVAVAFARRSLGPFGQRRRHAPAGH